MGIEGLARTGAPRLTDCTSSTGSNSLSFHKICLFHWFPLLTNLIPNSYCTNNNQNNVPIINSLIYVHTNLFNIGSSYHVNHAMFHSPVNFEFHYQISTYITKISEQPHALAKSSKKQQNRIKLILNRFKQQQLRKKFEL